MGEGAVRFERATWDPYVLTPCLCGSWFRGTWQASEVGHGTSFRAKSDGWPQKIAGVGGSYILDARPHSFEAEGKGKFRRPSLEILKLFWPAGPPQKDGS